MSTDEARLPIIGRESMLALKLTQLLHRESQRRHDYKPIVTLRYGYSFDLQLYDPDHKPTGVPARVTVEILPREAASE